YEFMHKSIQEFLTAEYIVRLGSIPDLTSIDGLGAEMAIAVAISSNAGEYVTRLAKEVDMKDNVSTAFLSDFAHRLVLERPTFSHKEMVAVSLLKLATRLVNTGRRLGNYRPARRLRKEDKEGFYMMISLLPESTIKEALKNFRKSPEWASFDGELV